jgi:hypothetical protein
MLRRQNHATVAVVTRAAVVVALVGALTAGALVPAASADEPAVLPAAVLPPLQSAPLAEVEAPLTPAGEFDMPEAPAVVPDPGRSRGGYTAPVESGFDPETSVVEGRTELSTTYRKGGLMQKPVTTDL